MRYPHMTGLLHLYQGRIWRDRAHVIVVKKARRIGGTFTVVGKSVEGCVRPRGRSTYYMSYNKDAGLEVMPTVERWSDFYEAIANRKGRSIWKGGDKRKAFSATRALYSNGTKFQVLSGNPDNIRGPGDRPAYIIDEMERHIDPDAVMAAVSPLLMNRSTTVYVVSTVNGEGPFWQLCERIKRGEHPKYSLHEIDFDLALEEGFYERIVADQVADPFVDDPDPVDDPDLARKLGVRCQPGAREQYRAEVISDVTDPDQELFCRAMSARDQYIPALMVRPRLNASHKVVRWDAPEGWLHRDETLRRQEIIAFLDANIGALLEGHRRNPPRRWFNGLDFGRSRDLTVMTWGYFCSVRLLVPLALELENCPTDDQRFFWDEVRRRLHAPLERAAVDMGGPGRDMADHVLREMGENATDMQSTSPDDWWRQWMPMLRKRIEGGTIELPLDVFVLQDLGVVRLINGVPRIPRQRQRVASKTKGRRRYRHGDVAVSLCLLNQAAHGVANTGNYSSTRAKKRKGMRSMGM